MTWIQQLYGKPLDLLDPQPEQICFYSMAVALSRLARYSGHTKEPWSVLQHSGLVQALVEAKIKDRAQEQDLVMTEAKLWAQLHDAHESAIGDITTPVAWALEQVCPGARINIDRIKDGLDRAILRALRLPDTYPSAGVRDLVKQCDAAALELERRHFLYPSERQWSTSMPAGFEVDSVVFGDYDNSAITWLHGVYALRDELLRGAAP